MPPVPAPGRRVAAGFIDLLPVGFVALALSDRVSADDGVAANLSGGRAVLALAIVLAYSFAAETLTGTTPGKWIVGLTVVDADERRPDLRAISLRTLFRPIDALPVLYLVGFIVMLATPDKQRIGDLVAKTRVVRRDDVRETAPVQARAGFLLGALTVVTLGIGAVSWAATSDDDDDDRVGASDYETDVVPLVDRTMDVVFRDPSADDLVALFAPGVATADEVEQSLESVGAGVGALDGEPRIVEHEVFEDQQVPGIGDDIDVVRVRLEATFENGPGDVVITLCDIDGDLRLLRWDVSLR